MLNDYTHTNTGEVRFPACCRIIVIFSAAPIQEPNKVNPDGQIRPIVHFQRCEISVVSDDLVLAVAAYCVDTAEGILLD